jgi:hypothetical protein
MRRGAVIALLLVAAVSVEQAAGAQHSRQSAESGAGSAAGRELPDPVELVGRLKANQKQLEERRKDYICAFTEETRTLDGQGAVKKTETKGYELFFEGSYPVVRQVSKEGKALDEHDAQKEERRVEEEVKKDRELAEKHGERENSEEVRVDQILHATVIKNGRYENYRGREALVYDFEPNREFQPHSRAESLANKLAGTVWIDAEDVEVARLEARIIDTYKVAGGLVGSVKKGSDLTVEQERVNGEVWLPSLLDFSLEARILLFKTVHERVVDRFSSYRKFRVETRVTAD